MSDERPPDFAMLRAVEVLAQFADRIRTQPGIPPPPLDRPVTLFNERMTFALHDTTREAVEHEFGIGFVYPTKGWHTYAMRHDGATALLSLFYDKNGEAIAIEHYYSKADDAPKLAPRSYGAFRFVPGEIELGASFSRLGPSYVPAVGGPSPVVYATAYEARFEGGLAYVMGNAGAVERLVLYVAA